MAMSQMVVRNLSPQVVERLKARARRHSRSLEAEVRVILESAAQYDMAEFAAIAARWRERLAGRAQTDSAELIREDRDTDHGRDV